MCPPLILAVKRKRLVDLGEFEVNERNIVKPCINKKNNRGLQTSELDSTFKVKLSTPYLILQSTFRGFGLSRFANSDENVVAFGENPRPGEMA